MKFLCVLGLHRWKPNGQWSTRKCHGCHHVEMLMYDRGVGEYWKRISE